MSGKDFEETLKDVIVEVVNRFGPISFDGLAATVLQLFFLDDDNCYTSFAEHEDIGWATVALVVEEKIMCDSDELLEGHNILFMPPREQIDMEPIKVVELFAGIGATRKALTRLGIPHTSVISEIDKFAVKSYNAIHGETENLGDISKIDRLPDCDLLTYGFPCQDVSIAGERKGFAKGSGTRSGLLWEVERLLNAYEGKLPKVLLGENVANLVSKKFMPGFQSWIATLATMGYRTSWAKLNATEFGVPQNRPRIFIVSQLGNDLFDFPIPDPELAKCTIGEIVVTIPQDTPPSYTEVRRLCPLECFRLMGFDDNDWYRASKVCSDSQLFKQAGNSIVVDVLEGIFRKLYIEKSQGAQKSILEWAIPEEVA